jgi:hypothetical protein
MEMAEHMAAGLRKAGLQIPEPPSQQTLREANLDR